MLRQIVIGIACSWDEVSVVTSSSSGPCTVHRIPLESGVIDPTSGKLAEWSALADLLHSSAPLRLLIPRARRIYLALPTTVALSKSWVEKGEVCTHSPEQVISKFSIFAADRADQRHIDPLLVSSSCVLDTRQRLRNITALVAHQRTVEGYVQAIGALSKRVERITTGAIARFNLYSFPNPNAVEAAVLIVKLHKRSAEISQWRSGMLLQSELLIGEVGVMQDGGLSRDAVGRADINTVQQSESLLTRIQSSIRVWLHDTRVTSCKALRVVFIAPRAQMKALYSTFEQNSEVGNLGPEVDDLGACALGSKRLLKVLPGGSVVEWCEASDAVGALIEGLGDRAFGSRILRTLLGARA